jgi:hypothetical protein
MGIGVNYDQSQSLIFRTYEAAFHPENSDEIPDRLSELLKGVLNPKA